MMLKFEVGMRYEERGKALAPGACRFESIWFSTHTKNSRNSSWECATKNEPMLWLCKHIYAYKHDAEYNIYVYVCACVYAYTILKL